MFAITAAGVAMAQIDVFIVNVAMPEIGEQFAGSSLGSLSWVLNAYAVVFAALLIPAGNLSDRTTARRTYLAGLALFSAASLLCALAPSVWLLVAARVVQAVGAALVIPSSLGLLLAAAPPDKRPHAVRSWAAISGLAAAVGPVLGGLLTQFGWHWIFLINLPIGVAAFAAGLRHLPAGPPSQGVRRADLLGAALVTAGTGAVALGLVKANDWGWASAATLGALAASVVLLALFVLRSARHPAPILPLGLLRSPVFSWASLANVVFAVSFAAMLLGIVFWSQGVWGWSALQVGLAIAPGPLMVPFFATTIGPVAQRFGAGLVTAVGCAVFIAGVLWWLLMLTSEPSYLVGMLPGMLLTGVGVGIIIPTLIGASLSTVPPQSFSTGSAVVTMARQFGTVLGVSALVAVFGDAETLTAGDFDRIWVLIIAVTAVTAVTCLPLARAGRAKV